MNRNTTDRKDHPVFAYLESVVSEEFKGTLPERLQQVCEAFNGEYNYHDNKRRYPNLQDRFAQWLMGLPSALSVEYRNYYILEFARKWGALPSDFKNEKQKERAEEKILENWFSFAARKFFQLCRFNKVDTSFLH